jgi:hypothetical protein
VSSRLQIDNRPGMWIDLKKCTKLAEWKGRMIGVGAFRILTMFGVFYAVYRTESGHLVLKSPSDSNLGMVGVKFSFRELSAPEIVALMFETGRKGKKNAYRIFPAEAEQWAHVVASTDEHGQL